MRRLTPIFAACLVVAGALPAEAKRVRGFDRDAFREGYREVLSAWALGNGGASSSEAAVRELTELERSAIEGAEGDVYEALRRAELGVVRGLMSRGVEILAPLTLLHQQAYLAHLESREIPLALHSRLLVVELVETYARQGPGLLASRFASDALTSLAGHLQEARSEGPATDLYERALELHKENSTALLALAVLWERHGDHERALPYLESLVRLHPDHREAQLRLSINLLRASREDRGEAGLRRLIEAGPSDWIRSLAFQELGQVLAQRGEWEEAHELMTRAVEVLPADPTLPIQLTYVSERLGVPYPEEGLLAALDRAVESPDLSPRFLYIRIPYEGLEKLRASLQSRGQPYLVELGRALGLDRADSATTR